MQFNWKKSSKKSKCLLQRIVEIRWDYFIRYWESIPERIYSVIYLHINIKNIVNEVKDCLHNNRAFYKTGVQKMRRLIFL